MLPAGRQQLMTKPSHCQLLLLQDLPVLKQNGPPCQLLRLLSAPAEIFQLSNKNAKCLNSPKTCLNGESSMFQVTWAEPKPKTYFFIELNLSTESCQKEQNVKLLYFGSNISVENYARLWLDPGFELHLKANVK